jgi:hypothetical protein
MNEDLKQLRRKMDSNDPFMSGGHQIVKIRTREKVIPPWATDNREMQKLLLLAFPKLNSNMKQRKAAARWGRVIHLFYRMNLTKTDVAIELRIKRSIVKLIIQRAKRLAAGRRSNNTGPRTRKA